MRSRDDRRASDLSSAATEAKIGGQASRRARRMVSEARARRERDGERGEWRGGEASRWVASWRGEASRRARRMASKARARRVASRRCDEHSLCVHACGGCAARAPPSRARVCKEERRACGPKQQTHAPGVCANDGTSMNEDRTWLRATCVHRVCAACTQRVPKIRRWRNHCRLGLDFIAMISCHDARCGIRA